MYDPDTVLNYEIGNKSTFMNGRLRVNASAFLMQWDDIQLQRWNDGSLWWQNGTVNGGTAETTGLEVDITGHLTENLRINANFSTGSAEYTEDIAAAHANFQLGQHLWNAGDQKEGAEFLQRAVALNPDSWNFFRQMKNLKHVLGSGGPEFMRRVRRARKAGKEYYPLPDLSTMNEVS